MEEMIMDDIIKINIVLKDLSDSFLNDYYEYRVKHMDAAKETQRQLVSKYRNEIPHIEKDLDIDIDEYFDSDSEIYINNLNNLKVKLEVLLINKKDEKSMHIKQSVLPVSIVNNNNNSSDNNSNNNLSNTNNNTNTVDTKVLFEDAKKKIDDDISLNDQDVEEILAKINELEELHSSDEKPRSKWNKSKEVMTWLFEKGPKVASTILPLITKVIEGQ